MRKIEFGELRITDLAKQHIKDCLDNNWASAGPKVKLFEEKWAKLFDYPYTTMVSSGTSAVTAACMALYDYGAKPGDTIICPALSFIATANAIRAAGFKPYFVDVRKETLCIDETKVESELKHRFTKTNSNDKVVGIIGVNLMGKPCRMDVLSDLCKKYNLKFIVDNCEAYGSSLNGKYALEYADFECTSHYIAHIICSAEGGTVSTKTERDNNLIRSIRSHGRLPDSLFFDHVRYGLNLKPTDLNASIGLGEIDDFHKIFAKRRDNLEKFREAVVGFENKAYFVEEDFNAVNAPHGFSITLREEYATDYNIRFLENQLELYGIHWKRNFGSMPDHKAFEDTGFNGGVLCPNARYIGKWGCHIGCHYWLSDEDINYVCGALKTILGAL